jgi:hypothetical protein
MANVTGTFFANVTTVYTMSVSLSGVGQGNDKVATIYPTGSNEPVPEVVVTGPPLSPLEPGMASNSENANNTVPWGRAIEHVSRVHSPYPATGCNDPPVPLPTRGPPPQAFAPFAALTQTLGIVMWGHR